MYEPFLFMGVRSRVNGYSSLDIAARGFAIVVFATSVPQRAR